MGSSEGDILASIVWISKRIRTGRKAAHVMCQTSRGGGGPGNLGKCFHFQRFYRNIMGKGIISGADIAIHLVDLREEQTWNQSGGAECDSSQCSLVTTGCFDTKTNSILKGNIIKIRSGTDSLLGHIKRITLQGKVSRLESMT